ncbi:MAG: hypothetical protein K2L41_02925, partial [Muribaculaceae bacterium]|nr:hypothetical protein [Muribaculaceae bacterium]
MFFLIGQRGSAQSLTAPYNPAMAPRQQSLTAAADTIMLPFANSNGVPQTYEELMADQLGSDLATPSNIVTTTEYDPVTRTYV